MKLVGITTTVPVEILLAAGLEPVDLNNLFISDPSPQRLLHIAEKDGFPLNCCSWIKGIYGVCLEYGIKNVLCVTTGDCSNTIMLMEVLRLKGLEVIPFAYPDEPCPTQVEEKLLKLAEILGTTLEDARRIREELKPVRRLLLKLDELTWKEDKVSGWENHLWLVSSSDFNRDVKRYRKELQNFIQSCLERKPYPQSWLRLGYIGVPSVYAHDLYHYLEENEARVVFNEVQRQFSMPEPGASLAEQYSNYTYPYSIYKRLEDIRAEAERRRLDGIIHYVQAFCHRGIGDIIFRHTLNLPILTIEGNDDFFLTEQLKTRLEAFLDLLRRRKMEGFASRD